MDRRIAQLGGAGPGPGAMPPPGPPKKAPFDPKKLLQNMNMVTEGEPATTAAPHVKSYAPINPLDYFDSETVVPLPSRGLAVHVLVAGPPPNTPKCPVVLCVHGGGYSAATWGPVVKRLKHKFRFVCPDMRGHGTTSLMDSLFNEDLDMRELVEDLIAFYEAFLGQESPPLMLCGHSLGGAVAARAAVTKRIPKLEATAVIDVVEGTALSSLPYIMNVLNSRPKSFTAVEEAVHWALKSHMTRNDESARVSVPTMLKEGPGGTWQWVTRLEQSEKYWEGWYKGMSDVFLAMPGYKLLMLAGTDRLDKTLTMGQMQGKFQLQVFAASGHAVHEDLPDEFASVLEHFLQHFRIGMGPLVIPKYTPQPQPAVAQPPPSPQPPPSS